MSAWIGHRVRELWLPFLVTALGSAVSAVVWGRLVDERREQVLTTAESIVAESRAAIELKVERHFEALRQRADFWSRFGRRPLAEWRAEATMLLHNVPGFTYLAWLGAGDAAARVAAGEEDPSPEELHRVEEDARTRCGGPCMVGPERDPSGAAAYRIFYPVPGESGRPSVLVAGVRVADLLGGVLAHSAPGYAISVRWDGQEIYARGVAADGAGLAWWRVREEIPLPLGAVWEIVHAPTAELVASTLTPLPHLLLAGGVLLSAAVGLITHQLRLTRRYARFLEASNRSLDARLGEARESEAALRRVSGELEARVQERTRELREAMAELEAFNYSVSHDLRSPLGAILNFVAVLEEDRSDRLDPAVAAVIARIRRSAERATALLEGLLQLSRTGRAQLQIEELDMEALVRDVFAQVRATRGDGRVELLVEPLPRAMGDRALVADVLANLLDNALKYSEGRQKQRVTVRGRAAEGENVYAVADNGIGFDMRFAAKLFGPFERLHPSDAFRGAGVGLAIVARIVRRHGGRVWAEGEVDRGACFYFSLPHPEDRSA
jgi:signal transduction histidine kinase